MPRDSRIGLPEGYRAQYLELLREVAEKHCDQSKRLCAFFPLCGDDYATSIRLMVVGRAVNGWEDGWNGGWVSAQMAREDDRIRLTNFLKTEHEDSLQCPMAWVVKPADSSLEYNTRRSAFWRVAHRIHDVTMGVCRDWSSRLCWTNLYKLAPSAGGNPQSWLCKSQLEHCANLLRIELSAYRPKNVLVFAGSDWFQPFAERLSLGLMPTPSCELVQQAGSADGVRWVIGKHPQGKSESRFTEEIVRFLDCNQLPTTLP
jgi:hypothetical protein